MEKRKKLLEKFINENFDLTLFIVDWCDDFIVSLIDKNNVQLTLICYDCEIIKTYIEDNLFLTYKLDKDLENNEYFRVI